MAAHDGSMGYPGTNKPQGDTSPGDHLNRLLAAEGEPFIRSFIRNVKEAIHPPKLPPLEVTSKPACATGGRSACFIARTMRPKSPVTAKPYSTCTRAH